MREKLQWFSIKRTMLQMERTDGAIWWLLAYIAGVAMRSFTQSPLMYWVLSLIVACTIAAHIASHKKWYGFIAIASFFALIGIVRMEYVLNKPDALSTLRDTEETVTVTGVVLREPEIRERTTQLLMKYEDHKILLQLPRFPQYKYGDKLLVKGAMQTPDVFADFNYKNFLQKDGIFTVMKFPEVTRISENNGNVIVSYILSAKNKLRTSLYKILPAPQSDILAAMMLGDQGKMSGDLKQQLNKTGLRHITAISGMHITILAGLLMFALIGMGLWKGQAFYAAICILLLYIIMIGAPPSAVRAGIMAGLLLVAEKMGRPANTTRFLLFAAAVMLFVNPFLLTRDVGFQLSFLAVLGIAQLSESFFMWSSPLLPWQTLRRMVAMTLSAQVYTMPILLYNFGSISLITPLTNILVVPLLGMVLLAGFLGTVFGLVSNMLGTVLSFPLYVLLLYITTVIDTGARLPFSSISIQNVSWLWFIPYYLLIVLLLQKQRRAHWQVQRM